MRARVSRLVRLEFAGLVILAVTIMWTLFVASGHDADPWRLAGTLTASVASLLLAERVSRRAASAVPLGLATLPLVVAAFAGRSLLGDGVLGYSNASGALYLIAAAAAAMLGLRTTSASGRLVATVAAAFWVALILLVDARTVAVFAGLLVVVLLVRSARAVRAAVVAGGVTIVLTLAMTVTLGLSYIWWLRTDALFRVVDSGLGQVRVALWHEALVQIAARPLSGVGPGRFHADSVALDEWATTVHNEILQVTAETGLTGGVLVLALLTWVFVLLWAAPLDGSALPAVVALVGIAVQANIDFTWHFPLVPIGGAALAGAALGYRSGVDPPPTPIARRRPAASVAMAGAAALAVVLLWPGGSLNPPYTEPNAVELTADGLQFVDDGVVYSRAAPTELYRRLTADNELSVEVWAATASIDQTGPARLVSSSGEELHRNFTLGQDRDALIVRLRTTETTLNGTPEVAHVREVFRDNELHHLVFTHDSDQVRVWVDGEVATAVPSPGGTFAEWIFSYPLLLGNEGGGERPWHGRLKAVGIYDRSLTAREIRERFVAGPDGPDGIGDAVAWYNFAASVDGGLSDRSPGGLGPELVIPERREAIPQGFLSTMVDVDQAVRFAAAEPDGGVGREAMVRMLAHVALFAVLAGLVMRAVPDRRHLGGVALALAAPVALATIVSVVRYTTGRSASVLDIAAAALGGLAAVLLVLTWRYVGGRRSVGAVARSGDRRGLR